MKRLQDENEKLRSTCSTSENTMITLSKNSIRWSSMPEEII